MFRRPRTPLFGEESPKTPAETVDVSRVLTELLSRPTPQGILEGTLKHGARLLGGEVKGYAVLRQGEDRIHAVLGYPRSLLGLALVGPWSAMRTRILSDNRELYQMNPVELHPSLDEAGLRNVPVSLVVPIADRGRNLGALILDRAVNEAITPPQQEAVSKWASAVAPLLGLFDTRDEWRHTAKQLSSALVEAVESQDFDALGHGEAVADICGRMGRVLKLSERDQEELWLAGLLHDIGKIHGEDGHAQIGANFLHGALNLGEAQRGIRHHHERWDGLGTPGQLSGEEIPSFARIIAVADTYVRAGSLSAVQAQAGKALDPSLTEVLVQALKDVR